MNRSTILALILAALALVYFRKPIVSEVKKLTRGIRNHNPGNIERTSIRWQGMSADQSGDPRFVVFDSAEYGVRALARVLQNYANQGRITVRAIIERWAPPSVNGRVENDTGAYVNAVAAALNVNPDSPINVGSALPDLVRAIIRHENGFNPYSDDTINAGVRMALV